MKKFVCFLTAVIGLSSIGTMLAATPVYADDLQTYGEVATLDTEGYIHFDSEGNIIDSNVDTNATKTRTAINHSSGRWVYYSDLYDWFSKKKGCSNHYSNTYSQHGSKAKVGSDVSYGRGNYKTWAEATAYGSKDDTFSCWYNPTGYY